MSSNNNLNTPITGGPFHSFDSTLGTHIGVEESILVSHFQFWIRHNAMKGHNLHEGKTWTYQSRKSMLAYFPYWNYERIKYLCEKLVSMGILLTNNFNKKSFDKTLWYAFVNEEAFGLDQNSIERLLKIQKGFTKGKSSLSRGKSSPPIPDTKQHIIHKKSKPKDCEPPDPPPPAKNETQADAFALATLFFNSLRKKKPNMVGKISKSALKDCEKLLKLRSSEEIMRVFEFALQDDFWCSNVMSPGKLLSQLDRLELLQEGQRSKNKKKDAEEARNGFISMNKKWSTWNLKNFQWKDERKIIVDDTHVKIYAGSRSYTSIGYADKNFKEIIENKMSDWGYTVN